MGCLNYCARSALHPGDIEQWSYTYCVENTCSNKKGKKTALLANDTLEMSLVNSGIGALKCTL